VFDVNPREWAHPQRRVYRVLVVTPRFAALLLAAVAGVAAAGGIASGASSTEPACVASQLTGTFSGIPGSAGAGSISYVLRLRNVSETTCFVSGIPQLRLVGKTGKLLPTRVRPSHPGALTAVRVVVAPYGYTAATARFSPDVPGVGESGPGPCEATAYRARVMPPPGGGTLVVPLKPATAVCEKGTMLFSAFVAGRNGPTS
jgi:hypothetical protein